MSNLIRSSRTTAATRFPGGLADSELGPVLHPFGRVRSAHALGSAERLGSRREQRPKEAEMAVEASSIS
jgi:hypothetical protein